ncbi:MAG TPA: hypothetical protein VM491_12945 [Burkholderiaceae bacterium]|nr:hypothetical protein [Burkholderiaceae bacterium]
MATRIATWEWHLTPLGWVPGLQTPPPDRPVRYRLPSDRVASYMLSQIASGEAQPTHGWTQTWAAPDAGAINELMRRFGALPAPVTELVHACGGAQSADPLPRVRFVPALSAAAGA